MTTRTEKDSFGSIEVNVHPASALALAHENKAAAAVNGRIASLDTNLLET